MKKVIFFTLFYKPFYRTGVSYIGFKLFDMKTLHRIIITAAAISACAVTAVAQPKTGQKQEMTPEQHVAIRAEHIAGELALDDATRTQFIDTYCNYFKEMHAIFQSYKPEGKPQEGQEPGQTVKQKTDKEIDQAIRNRLECSQKMLDLKVKYYEEYSKFLNPRQIQKVYDMQRPHFNRDFRRPDRRPAPCGGPYCDGPHPCNGPERPCCNRAR